MHRLALPILVLTAILAPKAFAEDNLKRASFDEVLQFVRRPQGGFGNMSPFELQVHYRLVGSRYRLKYVDVGPDKEGWLKVVKDPDENAYARICAAYFLAETSDEARQFLESQLNSKNLRHRYNAAEAVRLFGQRDPKKNWAIDLLLRHVSTGALDGSGVTSSPSGNYPDGDRDDIMMEPLDSFCWDLGFMKHKPAVPTLIGVLDRKPATGGAAFALGEIGDRKAIPVLIKILRDRSGYEHREVTALGKLKAKDAVPTLIARLGKPETTFSGLDNLEMEDVLESLLAIGDPRAVKPIKDYIGTEPSKSITAAANRVLVQLESDDPAAELIALLKKESYEPERSNLVFALVRYPKDARVLDTLSAMARASNSAFMRREVIHALGQINSRQSLLVLADLMEMDFPDDLKAEWGWKIAPKEFSDYFHKQIHRILREQTGRDFPLLAAPWKRFLATYQTLNNAEQTDEREPE